MTYLKMIDVDKSIFISRSLETDSVLRSLDAKGYTIFDQSLIEFKGLPFLKTPDTDWLFFYSRNAVKYFLSATQGINLLKYKIACLGNSAADEWEIKTGQNADFIGTGQPEQVSKSFKTILKNESVTFLRAENSRRSVIQALSSDKISEICIYSNQIKTNFDIPESKFLVFTSPLNVKAYLSKYKIKDDQIIIAIGHTTANSLPTTSKIYIPDHPNEASIFNLLKELI